MTQPRARFFKSAFFLCLGLGVYQFVTMEDLQSAEDSAQGVPSAAEAQAKQQKAKSREGVSAAKRKDEPASYLVSATAVSDLQKQREELAAKQKELALKEAELSQREKSVTEELKKLEVVRDTVEKAQAQRKREQDQKVTRMVETVLTMSPKTAAKLLSSVNETLAIAVMNQMDTPRLGKILNVMDTVHSSRLSELMTGLMKSKKAGQAASQTNSASLASKSDSSSQMNSNLKGGDKGDANQERANGGQSTGFPSTGQFPVEVSKAPKAN